MDYEIKIKVPKVSRVGEANNPSSNLKKNFYFMEDLPFVIKGATAETMFTTKYDYDEDD